MPRSMVRSMRSLGYGVGSSCVGKLRVLLCAIYETIEPSKTMLSGRDCRLAVDLKCYGETDAAAVEQIAKAMGG
jgi:hypothetical protein